MLWREIAQILMDENDSLLYVVDTDYNLKYINASIKQLLGWDKEEDSYVDRKCYELLQKKTGPCKHCKMECANHDSFYYWDGYHKELKAHFTNRTKLIHIEGGDYLFQISDFASAEVRRRKEIEQQLETEKALIACIKTLESSLDVNVAIGGLLENVAKHFNGDRAYIFEIDYDMNTISNTYEWVAEGITKEIDKLQNLDLEIIGGWMKVFKEKGTFYISSVDDNVDKTSEEYRLLQMQNIQSLIAVPLTSQDGSIVGFMGVDNPRRYYEDFTLMSSMVYFLQNDLEKRRVMGMLKRLSYEDALTGLYNRNCFNQMVVDYTAKPPKSLAVIYLDLNGLKLVNDTEGHLAGDALICNAANVIRTVFWENIYRIGGDEFVVVIPDKEEASVKTQLNKMNELMAESEIEVSKGISFRDENVSIEEQLHEADQAMYQDKEAYYKKNHDN